MTAHERIQWLRNARAYTTHDPKRFRLTLHRHPEGIAWALWERIRTSTTKEYLTQLHTGKPELWARGFQYGGRERRWTIIDHTPIWISEVSDETNCVVLPFKKMQ